MASSSTRLGDLPDVLQVRQVADFLGVAENTVYDAIRRHELHAVHLGRRLLVSKGTLVRWLEGMDEDGQTFSASGDGEEG